MQMRNFKTKVRSCNQFENLKALIQGIDSWAAGENIELSKEIFRFEEALKAK